MAEIKWDIKRGREIYRGVYDVRLKRWISTGKIRAEEVLVWRAGFSGWRKLGELEELIPYSKKWERQQLRLIKRKRVIGQKLPQKRSIKNILIIDDEEDLCSLLSYFLGHKGYNISSANTKKEAINCLRKNRPDLVFLDLKLPDGDGMEILPKIKKICPRTIVNMISAYGSGETREEAKKKGVYTFIDKPFTEREILRSITKYEKGREN